MHAPQISNVMFMSFIYQTNLTIAIMSYSD